ncbi:MAG: nitroreductase family protein [Faecousia sp.]
MDLFTLMRSRHSVRSYLDKPIEEEKKAALLRAIEEINHGTGLRFQLFTEEPEAFAANAAHYGAFRGCRNYFALVGPKGKEEAVGYWGQKLVLLAQELGLNTCWVALTYKKGKVAVNPAAGEKLHIVIALGYGADPGVPHKSKPVEKIAAVSPDDPQWFRSGLEAALLAPTAINQQQFFFRRTGSNVSVRAKPGPCSRIDLGIVKYQFELGAGAENFRWEA